MFGQLGNLCGRLGNGIAVLFLIAGAFGALFGTGYPDDHLRYLGPILAGVISAIVVWLIGRILHYIFWDKAMRRVTQTVAVSITQDDWKMPRRG